ncbi:MAG: hypothetical protein ACRET2_12175, partial [Steroidobacteraceae bacterium]
FGLGLSAMLLLLDLAVAKPGISIGQWRAAAGRTRTLAENDVPRAYAEALRLRATLPADAVPADRTRALNLLARTEVYQGLTAQAAADAGQALAVARGSGDRAGRVEADLNLALTSVNLGRTFLPISSRRSSSPSSRSPRVSVAVAPGSGCRSAAATCSSWEVTSKS